MNCACSCSKAPKLIFSCSGAADVGEITDRAARELSKENIANMFCLAGIGGRVSGIMKTTEAAGDILAIDGCPLNCVKNCLEEAGFTDFKHLQLAGLNMRKGESEVNEENIAIVAKVGKTLLIGE